ncbi:MAG: hypothetical protein ACTSR8_10540 [Promethearchaeota archaeon]
MSFIEKRNKERIFYIFKQLKNIEDNLIKLFRQRSIKVVDDVATSCSNLNKDINEILKLYPEIVNMGDKIIIKSNLQFYYDCLDKLTDFVRHVDQFHQLHKEYFDSIVEFIENKEELIQNKYKPIANQELIAFYDKSTRKALDSILQAKITNKEHEFFTFGPLEQEIKKIARTAGADLISILSAENLKASDIFNPFDLLEEAQSVISFAIAYSGNTLRRSRVPYKEGYEDFLDKNFQRFLNINKELLDYLRSKNYKAVCWRELDHVENYKEANEDDELRILDLNRIYLANGDPITTQHLFFINSVVTDAKLLPDS